MSLLYKKSYRHPAELNTANLVDNPLDRLSYAGLGIIDKTVHQRLPKVFSSQGWRKQEPGEAYPKVHTLLFQQLVCRALGEGIISEPKAAELLQMPLMRFHQIRKLKSFDAVTQV